MPKKYVKPLVILAAAIIIIVGVAVILDYTASKKQNNNQGNPQLKPITASDHLIGDIKAPVQIIIYSDFECPYCANFAATVKQIEQYFGDKVAIAFRHYPLPSHAEAMTAAIASECAAEQGKFWPMHDKLFADNKSGIINKQQFEKDAADLGLEQEKFIQCLETEKYKDKVLAQMLEGKNAGVTGTPTSFVNSEIYPGAYPFEDFTGSDGSQQSGMKSIITRLLGN